VELKKLKISKGIISMNIENMIGRVKLATKSYIKNDAISSAIVALASGKEIENIELFSSQIMHAEDNIHIFLSVLEKITLDTENNEEKEFLLSIKKEINKYFNKKTLTIVCGASSVGKDTILSELKLIFLKKGIEFDYLDKYTTRFPRLGENSKAKNIDPRKLEPSANYSFCDSLKDFENNKDICLDYQLYDHSYGFSKKHLKSNKSNLACIYGRLEGIEEFKNKVEKHFNRRTFTILLTSPFEILNSRLNRRHTIDNDESSKRLEVIQEQIAYIEHNNLRIKQKFDLILDNSNQSAICSLMDNILKKHFLKDIKT
jgi:guanylate kinase